MRALCFTYLSSHIVQEKQCRSLTRIVDNPRRIRDGESPHHQQDERKQDHKSKEVYRNRFRPCVFRSSHHPGLPDVGIQGYLVHLLLSSFCNELIMLTLHERTMKRS